ncbi:MAG: type III pantothenate kinase [Oscillospiraceae bacterium]|nr:type III pantothenate kinase [Oscillospiraceae bacterium]
MTILALDVGNTHIVLGCVRDGEIVSVARMATQAIKTEDEYAIEISAILMLHGIERRGFDGAILSSVVPQVTDVLCAAVERVTGCTPIQVGAGIKTGLNIRIDNPAQLGPDLVVGAVAALEFYKPPMVLIDMGTATTFSAIDANGAFLGGAIAPGVGMSLDALVAHTSLLQKISIEAPKHCIGTNTIDSMKSGVVLGAVAMLDGMIDRMEAEIGGEATVVATGGLSARVIPYCRHKILYDGDLLLKGLWALYKKNHK